MEQSEIELKRLEIDNRVKAIGREAWANSASLSDLRFFITHIQGSTGLTGLQKATIRKHEAIDFIVNGKMPDRLLKESEPFKPTITNPMDALMGMLDVNAVSERVFERLKDCFEDLSAPKPKVVKIEVKTPDGVSHDIEGEHFLMPLLMQVVSARVHFALCGEKGTGKTTACKNVAKRLGLRFERICANPSMTEYKLLGRVTDAGTFLKAALYDIYKNGGLFLIDEMDNSDPSFGVIVNMAADGKGIMFPNGECVEPHKDFVLGIGMNTIGQGADARYVGRFQLDAATLDRFCRIDWPLDPSLEDSLMGIPKGESGRYAPIPKFAGHPYKDANSILIDVDSVRKRARELHYDESPSPRASLFAKRLTEAGVSASWVREVSILKGYSQEQKKKLWGDCFSGDYKASLWEVAPETL